METKIKDRGTLQNFLCKAKNFMKATPIEKCNVFFVIGNESADLDSIISAIVYAFYLHEKVRKQNGKDIYVPVVCIPEEDMHLRTEVIVLFQKCGIDLKDIVYINEVNFLACLTSYTVNVTLVDHNDVGTHGVLKNSVHRIVDHHQDSMQFDESKVCKNIKMVGSCCTLVAEEIYYNKSELLSIHPVAELLLAAILIDTINLDLHSARTVELDVFIGEVLSQHITQDPDELFELLQKAKLDISPMSSYNILRKDYKKVPSCAVQMGISSVMLEPSQLLARGDFLSVVQSYLSRNELQAIVIMFIYFDKNSIPLREIAVVSESVTTCDRIVTCLLSHTKKLDLYEIANKITNVSKPSMRLFKQANVKSSRKVVLPLLQEM
ncbi:exopolyphosphatase PRUNE1-like [Hydractinia symbiolongicarpus]|uniref:exopolyphosphatase PRUNE1-like n=1 Tax=Hydractinia symbiolongicarpus TaxID=13093 RepID=UPI00254B2DBB|nr:exopolyphosphatase PRUNE1-like [Hydractinia symbiolongicarpus]